VIHRLKNKLKLLCLLRKGLVYFCIFILSQSCDKKEGSFLTELAFENLVVIASGNGSNRSVSIYDLNGNLIKVMGDFRTTGGTPRGVVYIGDQTFLVAQDNADKIDYLGFNKSKSAFHGSNYYSGTIYDLVKDSRGNIYSTETNRIEKFSPEGNRLPLSTGNSFIHSAIGACSISNARELFMTDDDMLIVASYSGGRIVVYDVSTDTPTCVTSVSVGTTVYGVLLHSNGSLYFTRWSNDSIYRANPDGSGASIIWSSNTGVLNNPASLAEMPDGSILVGGYSNHTVERIDEDGNRIGNIPFIADGQTLSIADIIILEEDEE